MITDDNAKDELFGIVKDYWTANANALFGYVPALKWEGQQSSKPDASKLWGRVSSQIVTQRQASLAGKDGTRLYTTVGLLYVQLFASRIELNGLETGRKWGSQLRNQFRKPSPSGELRFRDAKVVPLVPTAENYPLNVVATFEYETSQ